MIAVLVANRQLALKTNKIINWKKLNKLSQRFKIKERSFVNIHAFLVSEYMSGK